ncbi:MAG: CopG family transcriptional regulator [archaeon YNP-WB-062]|jgi:predicted DNA-binding protein|nr:CopG family transcriptional regulator [Candidatus Culexarchaeum yellowstonense]
MSTIVCVRIPRELKERMQRLNNVNWSKLIREFIEETISRLEAEEVLKKIEGDLRDIPELPSGTTSRWIRIDRESH